MQPDENAIPSHVPTDRVVEFDVYSPAKPGEGYFEAWKAFQDRSSELVWSSRNGGHWVATRGKIIREVFEDFTHFSSKAIFVPRERGEINILPTTADPPQHRAYRGLINKSLAPATVRLMEPAIRDYTIELIEGLKRKGHCEFIADFARHLPIGVFFRMAALPISDQDMLGHWMEQVMRPDGSMPQTEALENFARYLKPRIDERRANPGADILSAIVAGRIDDREVTDDEAINMCTAIVLGGLDTVITLMSFVMVYLAQTRTAREYLRDNPKVLPQAVEEFCRRFPIGVNARLVTQDFVFHDTNLKAGDMVSMPQALYSLDETIYERPLEVDFKRNASGYVSFGHGVHRCPGAFLGKSELSIMLEEWIKRIPDFEIPPGVKTHVTSGVTSGIFNLPLHWAAADQTSTSVSD